MADICTDNRFELIEKYKKNLIESTNIESAPDEMAVLDNLLFRIWQMGWLDRLEQPEQRWIPCSERLPKPFEYCLWTTTDGRVVYHHCDGLFSNYTAWMPLPEPYKGVQK